MRTGEAGGEGAFTSLANCIRANQTRFDGMKHGRKIRAMCVEVFAGIVSALQQRGHAIAMFEQHAASVKLDQQDENLSPNAAKRPILDSSFETRIWFLAIERQVANFRTKVEAFRSTPTSPLATMSDAMFGSSGGGMNPTPWASRQFGPQCFLWQDGPRTCRSGVHIPSTCGQEARAKGPRSAQNFVRRVSFDAAPQC